MYNRNLEMIVAMDKSRGIGYKGSLPWPRIPEDMTWFRKHTLGKSVIMGRRTAESIGKPLEKRQNIVISSKPEQIPEGFTVASTLAEAIRISEHQSIIIGGASVYEQALPSVKTLYLTKIDQEFEADTLFPNLGKGWTIIDQTTQKHLTFEVLEKTKDLL